MVWKKTHRRGAENAEKNIFLFFPLCSLCSLWLNDLNPCNFML
jgi:hypothetical protein